MKVFSTFSGIEGFGIPMIELGWEIVGCSEVNKYASSILKYHYPDVKNYGDITKIDFKSLPDFDLLCGGVPCFVKGTKVLTNHGYKNIEDVDMKDKLWTHKNRFQPIVNLQVKKHSGDIINIKPHYHYDAIKCTPEHPFYARSKIRTWDNANRKYKITYSDPTWIPANELSDNHYLGLPINKDSIIPEFKIPVVINQHKKVIKKIKLDKPDMWFMMGYFLGDGWLEDNPKADGRSSHTIKFSINNKDIKFVVDKISTILPIVDKKSDSGACKKYGCHDIVWFSILNQLRRYARHKIIPEWVQSAPIESIRHFIDGYVYADGSYNSITTTSYNITLGIQRLFAKANTMVGTNRGLKKKRKRVIMNRLVNENPTYLIRGWEQLKRMCFIENDYVWYKIDWVAHKKEKNIDVFNFEVKQDNSYCVGNLAVHNCQSWSIAGKRGGFDDERGNMWWQFIEILKVKQPKYFLAENVKGLLSHEGGESIEKILEEMCKVGYVIDFEVLNSKNFGVPQNRERVFIFGIRKDLIDQEEIISECNPRIEEKINEQQGHQILLFSVPSRWEKYCFVKRCFGEGSGSEVLSSRKDSNENNGTVGEDLSFCLDSNHHKGTNTIEKGRRQLIISNYYNGFKEDIRIHKNECPTIRTPKGGGHLPVVVEEAHPQHAEIKQDIYAITDSGLHRQKQIRTKTLPPLRSNTGASHDNLIVVAQRGRGENNEQQVEPRKDGVTNSLTSVQKDNLIVEKEKLNNVICDDIAHCLNTQDNRKFKLNNSSRQKPNLIQVKKQPLKFLTRNQGEIEGDYSFTVDSSQTSGVNINNRIRRLTPVECEKLQSFPIGYTQYGLNDKNEKIEISDAQRYKVLGNAITVNVVREITKNIKKYVDKEIKSIINS